MINWHQETTQHAHPKLTQFCILDKITLKVNKQRRSKFNGTFTDLHQINYIEKNCLELFMFLTILLNDQDLHKYLSTSWLNLKVINNFLQVEMRKKDITIVNTRLFVDVKSQRISDEVLMVFTFKEHMEKSLICITVHYKNKHWYLINIFRKSNVVF